MGYLEIEAPRFYFFLSGAAFFGAMAGGTFFMSFWSKTRERLFLIFGISFWIMAVERLALLTIIENDSDYHFLVYLLRLLAFLAILYGIADKNRQEKNGA